MGGWIFHFCKFCEIAELRVCLRKVNLIQAAWGTSCVAGQEGIHREEFRNKRQRKLVVILYDFVTDSYAHFTHKIDGCELGDRTSPEQWEITDSHSKLNFAVCFHRMHFIKLFISEMSAMFINFIEQVVFSVSGKSSPLERDHLMEMLAWTRRR